MIKKVVFGILLLLGVFLELVALPTSRINTSIPPGTFSKPVMVTFSIPSGTRLSVSINEDPEFEYSESFILNTAENTEQNFFVTARLFPLDPEGIMLEKKLFYWKIDRKSPSPPHFIINEIDGGYIISMIIDEPGTIKYSMFHSVSGASGTGTLLSNEPFFLPLNSSLVAWGIDSAGNIGPSSSPSPTDIHFNKNPFTVLNPVSGTWSNMQALLIEAAPGVEVYYSVNESDSSIFDTLYTGPVVLENEGVVSLRVMAIDSEGKRYTTQILYTVTSKTYPEFGSLDTSGAFLELGEFGEFNIPSGYVYEIGGVRPYFTGDTSLVFSAIRDVSRYYPLTLSNDTNTWRWVCKSGSKPLAQNLSEKIKDSEQTVELSPEIHNWNYLSFNPSYSIFYSLDKKTWKKYYEPIFISREMKSEMFWYSPSFKKGEVQKLSLPARPSLTGLSLSSINSNSVFLGVTDSPYSFYIETGSLYYPSKPSVYSPSLSSGLLFEVPLYAESYFTVRVLAVYEGISHGELYASFKIDRKSPRRPVLDLLKDLSFSRKEIQFTPRGEDTIKVSIIPPLYRTENESYILTGDKDRAINYTINFYSQDDAGNKSEVTSFSTQIDLNALYINSDVINTGKADGSPTAPFTELDSALELVKGSQTWRLYIQGSPALIKAHFLNSHVSFLGTGGKILFGSNASLIFSSSSVSIENLEIIQDSSPVILKTLYPINRDGFSLLEFRNSALKANNVQIFRNNQFSGALISAINTSMDCQNSIFSIESTDFAQIFNIESSSLKAENCTFTASSRDVSAVALTNSTLKIENSGFSVNALMAGRAIESWSSFIHLNSVSFKGQGKKTSLPVAIWLDKKSSFTTQQNVSVYGFENIFYDVLGKK